MLVTFVIAILGLFSPYILTSLCSEEFPDSVKIYGGFIKEFVNNDTCDAFTINYLSTSYKYPDSVKLYGGFIKEFPKKGTFDAFPSTIFLLVINYIILSINVFYVTNQAIG